MGWYDHENDGGLPAWAIAPITWIGCFLVAVPPTAAALAVWNVLLPTASPFVALSAYGLCLVVLLAAIRPWTAR